MIGVFDSGYGGLTILRALVDRLPEYSYVYFADNARSPYGERSQEEITEFTKEGVARLFSEGAQIVLLGCNTASSVALRWLQQEWLPAIDSEGEKRILGIVVPTVEQITGADWRHNEPITTPVREAAFTIGVLATPATVAAGAYPSEIQKRNPSLAVVQQACPGLVDAIESDDSELIKELVNVYTDEFSSKAERLEALLLGCTHYELIADLIREHLPEGVRLYHQPSIVADSLAKYLERHTNIAARIRQRGERNFLTTADPAQVTKMATRYFGEPASFVGT